MTNKFQTPEDFVNFLKKEYAKHDISFEQDGFDEGMWIISFEHDGVTLYGSGIIAPGLDGEISYDEYDDNLEAYLQAFSHFIEGGTDSFAEQDTDSEEEFDKIENVKEYVEKISDSIYEKI